MSAEPVTAGTTSAGDRKSGGQSVHVIRSDDEALETVAKLAEGFRKTAMRRDRERILPFDEITDVYAIGELRRGPRQRERTDLTWPVALDASLLKDASNLLRISDLAVACLANPRVDLLRRDMLFNQSISDILSHSE